MQVPHVDQHAPCCPVHVIFFIRQAVTLNVGSYKFITAFVNQAFVVLQFSNGNFVNSPNSNYTYIMPSWLPSITYPPAGDGYWSPVTSTINWCEEAS